MVDNQNKSPSIDESPYSLALDTEFTEDVEALEGESHLRFFLPSGNEFALSAMGIREIMQQEPGNITPVPNASPLLLGTINLRGEIIWVADLGQFLGYPNMLNTDRGEVPVIAVEEQDIILGLAVKSLGAIHWLEVDNCKYPKIFRTTLRLMFKGNG